MKIKGVSRRGTSVEAIARKDHEQNCRNEPEWPFLSVSHRHVHEMRAHAIRPTLSSETVPDEGVGSE